MPAARLLEKAVAAREERRDDGERLRVPQRLVAERTPGDADLVRQRCGGDRAAAGPNGHRRVRAEDAEEEAHHRAHARAQHDARRRLERAALLGQPQRVRRRRDGRRGEAEVPKGRERGGRRAVRARIIVHRQTMTS